ncbi:MAG: hypothetical protein COZ06_36355 [Armatimonadetes bacterium CG_4_10_14_3_um_filter_66_18]|nr:MAG: hypothetical protein COS65_01380 [Armatimonadetes bacterium CG06_land_8_20_14_3_00_66_21]PIW15612.1 MAG: hypothetical protein COW34_06665 [Armatimonadetes bacterium CG17_big_fil_post_rev_8_21_14_2_50_66_6]PIX43393.1 MAG: hypothetical protein COZ57_19265 [Armatimonadetes bacterium CG_4_8_14_3_um_filter_66_20]PIY36329.1 MAG: hypothetical protein COZ06_36355 [Armatimonadetes bacterium CG_4_10_14_3_um_filter_66_18]PIZ40211.1 MAG: hypothetical protein COY42_21625 [Armatimonadetes bacterium C
MMDHDHDLRVEGPGVPGVPLETPAGGGPPNKPPPVSGLARRSVLCGVAGICCFVTAPLGVLFGLAAFPTVSASRGGLRGHGLAATGVILSSLITAFQFSSLGLFRPSEKARMAACQGNLRQIGQALESYTIQHGRFPQASSWCDAVLLCLPDQGRDVLKCPSTPRRTKGESHYAYNRKLSTLRCSTPELAARGVAAELVVVVDSLPGWNRSAYKSADARHTGGANVLFLDGHVKWVRGEEVPKVRWDVPPAVPAK